MPTILKTKNSVTTTVVPTTLQQGELAVNITDKKMWVGNAATTPVQILGAGVTNDAGGSNTQVQYNSSGVLAGSANMTFSGTALTLVNDASISGLTVGKGGGAVSLNTVVGNGAGFSNTTGNISAYFGYQAGYSNTTGGENTAFGYKALFANTTANYNNAFGGEALQLNTTGGNNNAFGTGALGNSTTGNNNAAFGGSALVSNTTGGSNVAVGQQALNSNTTASNNTAVGFQAGYSGTTAANNVAMGYQALYSNATGGGRNTAIGNVAGYGVTTGEACSFFGDFAGYGNTTGSNNTYIGRAAGYLMTTGSKNTILGRYDGNQGGLDIRTASNYIVLSDGDGNPRVVVNPSGFTKMSNSGTYFGLTGPYHEIRSDVAADGTLLVQSTSASFSANSIYQQIERNTTNNTFYAYSYYNGGASAYKYRIADSGNVTNTNGSYGTISDVKNKENIVDATPKLDKINQLQVRNFNFKGDDLKQIGFIAQEFEQVFPSMVEEHKDTDAEGNDLGTTTKSIKTSVLVPILVKAIQELKAEFDAYKATHP